MRSAPRPRLSTVVVKRAASCVFFLRERERCLGAPAETPRSGYDTLPGWQFSSCGDSGVGSESLE